MKLKLLAVAAALFLCACIQIYLALLLVGSLS